MQRLNEYLLSQNRRLVASVGDGRKEDRAMGNQFMDLNNRESIARRLQYQEHVLGYDFVSATIPSGIICRQIQECLETAATNCSRKTRTGLCEPNQTWGIKHYLQSIGVYRKMSSIPVGGASFGPFTLAGELMGIESLCLACIDDPDRLESLLDVVTDQLVEIAMHFESSGAAFIWLAEPTALMISSDHFRRFVKPFLQKVFESVSLSGFLHIPGDTNHLLGELMDSGPQCLSLDSMVDFRTLAHQLPAEICVRGNINSLTLLYEPKEEIVRRVHKLNHDIRHFPQFIIGSGGGLAPGTPEQNICAISKETRQFPWRSSKDFHDILQIWKWLAMREDDQGKHSRIDTIVGEKAVLINSIEEACFSLALRRQNRIITPGVLAEGVSRIEALLHSENISGEDLIEIADKKWRVAALRGRSLLPALVGERQ